MKNSCSNPNIGLCFRFFLKSLSALLRVFVLCGIKFSEALYEDHKIDIVCLMPTNVYGKNDHFDKVNGHVIPAMITKLIDAKKNKKNSRSASVKSRT